MSSEIVGRPDQPSAVPVLWKMVERARDAAAAATSGRNAAEREEAARLEQLRRDAFTQGMLAGRQEAEEQIRPALEGLARSISELAKMREIIREESTRDLVHLSISIAARIIHRDVTIDPDALAGLVKAAFSKVQSRELQRVRMHPGMESLVRKYLEQCGASRSLEFTMDSSLKKGDVLFETSQGALDASIETQLQEIERGLIDRLER
jgi:flagellar assembly protein FliH